MQSPTRRRRSLLRSFIYCYLHVAEAAFFILIQKLRLSWKRFQASLELTTRCIMSNKNKDYHDNCFAGGWVKPVHRLRLSIPDPGGPSVAWIHSPFPPGQCLFPFQGVPRSIPRSPNLCVAATTI